MKSVWKLAFALVFSLVLSGTALAGLKSTSTVYVNAVGRYANGSLGAARNSPDSNQYIGCYSYVMAGSSVTAYCYARDAANTYGSCRTTDPALIQVAQSVVGDSHIWFSWNADGVCTEIDAYNVSQTPPKNP